MRARTRPQHGSDQGDARDDEDVAQPSSSRRALRPGADIPERWRRERRRENHPRNEAPAIGGISRVSKQVSRRCGARTHVTPVPRTAGSAGGRGYREGIQRSGNKGESERLRWRSERKDRERKRGGGVEWNLYRVV